MADPVSTIERGFAETLEAADVGVRRLEANIEKLRKTIVKIERAAGDGNLRGILGATETAVAQFQGLMVTLQTPDLTKWRIAHRESLNAGREQQTILEQKLSRAKQLLVGAGWDPELLEEDLKAHCPRGRELARRSFNHQKWLRSQRRGGRDA